MFARAAAVLLLFAFHGAIPAEAEDAVILPFANVTSAGALPPSHFDWIGESIAETLRDALGTRGVTVHASRETGETFRRLNLKIGGLLTQASALKVGERLDAEQVVFGTFEFVPTTAPADSMPQGTLKITARVLDRRRLRQSPEFTETGNLDDLTALEAHLAWRTLTLVAPKLAPPEAEFRTLGLHVRLDAQENYIRGLLARTPEQQEKLFLQAARLDARFAHPVLQLGRMYLERKEYRKAAEWLQKIPETDSHSGEISFLLGLALLNSGDAIGAEKALQRVARLVPLSEVWNNLGAAQSRQDLPQAVESFRKALEGDPNDPVYHFNLGYAQWKKGDFTTAADRFRAVLDRQPDDQMATLLLGVCLKKQTPRQSDARLQGIERLKTNYEEHAYLQLKSIVEPER